MADRFSPSDPSLASQLEATLGQLEQVIQKLQANPQQGIQLPRAAVDRLQATASRLAVLVNSSATSAPAPLQPGPLPGDLQTEQWDDFFAESVETDVSASPQVNKVKPRKKGKFGILATIATALLGILVGIVLWIGIPPLNLPPLWDQLATQWANVATLLPTKEQPPVPLADSTPNTVNTSPEKTTNLVEETGLPTVLEAPSPPAPVAVSPLPLAPLTPEQSLLAVIQRELVDLEGLYPPQLMERIEPNFLASRLTLTVGDSWQELSPKQQQTLLDALWQRAQKLSFRRLWIYDLKGDLIARSPVVGQDMVVFNLP
ncbi:sll0066 [Synechocystis sp. PCC 6803]|jgi:hypothetical protein|uniref:Sll0066 protein n=1 Tax=Synechocystis sp. (strain ATCC 27184 / PCC 6803 / Kazusa) TaxID=1111708 RepID=Q55140_SYNY3|nr:MULTISPECIES: hypothetical protein [unclassified Synechocystis]BAM54376.1 hypothetical protein BEST7613_5445 [Synechocystis sp. PCC 6803] [Bacillus subtilis BEST7613]AGF52567.1 hypothetical protein MYO_123350 [Synechocystis sp. PCC 6803]ALJ68491.1 hypothetical protein AOY38_12005 [Synechocystis sp. PCC 6803]AVP90335.1 hypothetical protein C7I86_12080 [Synechocystis sp. IPPAS B-1465]MBD2616929.1 hypothetical protein [Synechocystis sp. FACHB-898]